MGLSFPEPIIPVVNAETNKIPVKNVIFLMVLSSNPFL
jgi:hypothetical protein